MADQQQKPARGWRRYQELRRQDEADKAKIIAGLIADLGREPTMRDQLAIEQIAALTVWARTLERRGKFAEAAEIRDQITRSQRTNGITPDKPAPKEKPSIAEQLAMKGYRPPSALSGERDDRPLSEGANGSGEVLP